MGKIGRLITYKSREEIMEAFKKNVIENNIQGQNGYRKFNNPSINVLRKRCGLTFNQALEEVGLKSNPKGLCPKGVEYYKAELNKLIKELGYIPKHIDIANMKLYKFNDQHLKKTIGYTYEKLLMELGYDPKNIYSWKYKNLTKEKVLEEYIKISKKLDRL